jgi:ABC-type lipoprotein release transport system permease subunit
LQKNRNLSYKLCGNGISYKQSLLLALMFFLFAWRNVWRNPSRTVGLVFSLALSIAGLWVLGALVRGLNEQRLEERLQTSLGHLKLTSPRFLSHKPSQAYFVFDNLAKEKVTHLPLVSAYAPRLNVRASLQQGKHWHTVDVYGVQPTAEKKVLSLFAHVRQGVYLTEKSRQDAVVGKELARMSGLQVGDSLLLSLPAPLKLRIVGVYDVPNYDFSKTHIFVPYQTLRTALGLPADACHQLLLKIQDANQTKEVQNILKTAFPTLWVRTWQETAPDLAYMHTLTSFFLGVLVLVASALLGALQYILLQMNWQERLIEWQRLRAWGLTKGELWRVWAMEVLLMLSGGLWAGSMIGGGALWILAHQGIDLAWFADGLGKMGYATRVLPVVLWQDWAMIMAFFALLPCLQLAWKKISKESFYIQT